MSVSRGLPSSRLLHNPVVRRRNRLAGIHRSIRRQHAAMKAIQDKAGAQPNQEAKTLLGAMDKSLRRMGKTFANLMRRVARAG